MAFVEVERIDERREIDEEALVMMPTVVVGVIASCAAVKAQFDPVPPAPLASFPSQRPEPPVIATQKSSQELPITLLKLKSEETCKFVEVALVDVERMLERREIDEEALTIIPFVVEGVIASCNDVKFQFDPVPPLPAGHGSQVLSVPLV